MSEVVKLPKFVYAPQSGSLALMPTKSRPNASIEWYGCREQFHRAVIQRKLSKDFLFSCPVAQQERVIKFMQEVEGRIGLAASDKVEFRKTDNPAVMLVVVGPWWPKQNVRLSLLTALLRCGQQFVGVFNTALFSRFYTVDTKPAVERFLEGHTWFLGNGSQWHQTFRNYRTRKDYAERVLVRDNEVETLSDAASAEAKHIIATAGTDPTLLHILIAKSLDRFRAEGNEEGQVGADTGPRTVREKVS